MKQNIKIILAIIVIVLIGLLVEYSDTSTPAPTKHAEQIIEAMFRCDNEKTIQTTFRNGEKNSVDIKLNNSRSLSLPQAISASGARYANDDETFVFWNKGNTAFITENGTSTFTNCIQVE
jgi:membrane-bound inhibitor of C-type lysozyme